MKLLELSVRKEIYSVHVTITIKHIYRLKTPEQRLRKIIVMDKIWDRK